jgi:quinol monooxygenase YgiN
MIIVSGHLVVVDRDTYLEGCREVVARARAAEGCLDFALSPDLLDPDRVNVLEQWDDADRLAAFRGSGVPEDQGVAIRAAVVSEHHVTGTRRL